VGYIGPMFEVLVFVYENYWRGDACPEPEQLGRKLSAQGFDAEEIRDALRWLDGLSLATQGVQLTRHADGTSATVVDRSPANAVLPESPGSMRVYSTAEQEHLGAECLGFISFLESSRVLPSGMREIVIERAMATSGDPLALDELKIIVLMVHWSTGVEPDALVLDELCDDASARVAH
jgi:Smg protein